MRPLTLLLAIACLAARPATAQRLAPASIPYDPFPGDSVRPRHPPPALLDSVARSAKAQDYRWEGAIIGGVGLGLFGATWLAQLCGLGDAPQGSCRGSTVGGALMGATVGVVVGGLIGGLIPKGPCCREEPQPDP